MTDIVLRLSISHEYATKQLFYTAFWMVGHSRFTEKKGVAEEKKNQIIITTKFGQSDFRWIKIEF